MSFNVEANHARILPTAEPPNLLSPVVAAILSVPTRDPDARIEPGVE